MLPRCFLDYGESGDALDNATDAMRIVRLGLRDGILEGVRWPPGIPAFIYMLTALVPWGGHVASNLAVFAFYLGSVAVFWRLTAKLPNGDLLLVTFALTPLLLHDAALTQDFVPGAFFVLAAYLALENARYLWAGVLLGVATAFRITNVLLILPATMYVVAATGGWPLVSRIRTAATMNIAAVGCGLAFYFPYIYYSGLGWRYFVPTRHGEIYLQGFAYNTVYVFGPLALIAIIGVTIYERRGLAAWLRTRLGARSPGTIFCIGAIVTYLAVCFRFPNKISYYDPAIPFFYLLLAEWISTRGLRIIAAAVVSFSLIGVELKGGKSGKRTLRPHLALGCVLDDWIRRSEINELRHGISELRSLGKAVVITGMSGVLTQDNPALELTNATAISPGLDPSAGKSIHRGVTDIVFQVRNSQVFLMPSLSRADVRFLQAEGFKMYMFSEYAPSGLRSGYGYDPYQEGIETLPIFTDCTFYRRSKCNSAN